MEEEIVDKIENLKLQHKELDDQISDICLSPLVDQLAIQRLKKKKLEVKDMIAKLQNMLQPDMIA